MTADDRLPLLQDPRRRDPADRSPTATTARVAFKDIGPKAPLHELVIPTRAHRLAGRRRRPSDVELLGHLMVVAAQRAKESGLADNGFRVVMNAGADAGQSVHHVHLHVLAGRPLAWPPG